MIEMRPAAAADAAAVLALWRDAESVITVTDDMAAIEMLIAHDRDALIVAEADGEIVGSVVGAWDGWRGEIYRLAVAPSHRRQGLANRLLDAAFELCDQLLLRNPQRGPQHGRFPGQLEVLEQTWDTALYGMAESHATDGCFL